MARTARRSPRQFDPVALGRHECDAWVGYYRRDWRLVLSAAYGLVHEGFGMSPRRTVHGAWLVLRANQAWAPYPDNDRQTATARMTQFYALVARCTDLRLDPATAAGLEVAWWHEHRVLQRERPEDVDEALVDAVAALYSYVYGCPLERVRAAAAHRAHAMRLSDAWVDAGCDPDHELVARERQELITSYSVLLDAVALPSIAS